MIRITGKRRRGALPGGRLLPGSGRRCRQRAAGIGWPPALTGACRDAAHCSPPTVVTRRPLPVVADRPLSLRGLAAAATRCPLLVGASCRPLRVVGCRYSPRLPAVANCSPTLTAISCCDSLSAVVTRRRLLVVGCCDSLSAAGRRLPAVRRRCQLAAAATGCWLQAGCWLPAVVARHPPPAASPQLLAAAGSALVLPMGVRCGLPSAASGRYVRSVADCRLL